MKLCVFLYSILSTLLAVDRIYTYICRVYVGEVSWILSQIFEGQVDKVTRFSLERENGSNRFIIYNIIYYIIY